MAHWSKIGKTRLGNYSEIVVFTLTFASSCSARTRVTSTVSIRHEQPTGTLRRVVTAWPSYYATFFRPCSPRALLCVQKPAFQVPQEDCGAERLTLVDMATWD
jgi:hypothetical protein